MRNTGDGGKKRNRGCGVCAAYKSYNIPGALEVADGDTIRIVIIRILN